MSELLRALGALADATGAEQRRLLDLLELPHPARPSEHTELFVLHLPPYASPYLGAEGMLGGETRDRIAGFWRAIGIRPGTEPDHLTALLSLYAGLREAASAVRHASRQRWHNARRALLWEHLAPWLVPYLDRVSAHAGATYRRWAALLAEALEREAELVGAPVIEPLHIRVAPPPLDAPVESLEKLVGALLTPIRSGLILTRADIARAARDLQVGLRLRERAPMLRDLVAYDAAGSLRWLETEATRRAAKLRARSGHLGDVAAFWADRAEKTATLLAGLGSAPPNSLKPDAEEAAHA